MTPLFLTKHLYFILIIVFTFLIISLRIPPFCSNTPLERISKEFSILDPKICCRCLTVPENFRPMVFLYNWDLYKKFWFKYKVERTVRGAERGDVLVDLILVLHSL